MGCTISKKPKQQIQKQKFYISKDVTQLFKYDGYLVKEEKCYQDTPFSPSQYTVHDRKLISVQSCFVSYSANNSPQIDNDFEKINVKHCNSNEIRSSRSLLKPSLQKQKSLYKYCANTSIQKKTSRLQINQTAQRQQQKNSQYLNNEVVLKNIKKTNDIMKPRVRKILQNIENPSSSQKQDQQQIHYQDINYRKNHLNEDNLQSDYDERDSTGEISFNMKDASNVQNMNELYPITQQKKQKNSITSYSSTSNISLINTQCSSSLQNNNPSIDFGSSGSFLSSINNQQQQSPPQQKRNSSQLKSLQKLTAVIREKSNSSFNNSISNIEVDQQQYQQNQNKNYNCKNKKISQFFKQQHFIQCNSQQEIQEQI